MEISWIFILFDILLLLKHHPLFDVEVRGLSLWICSCVKHCLYLWMVNCKKFFERLWDYGILQMKLRYTRITLENYFHFPTKIGNKKFKLNLIAYQKYNFKNVVKEFLWKAFYFLCAKLCNTRIWLWNVNAFQSLKIVNMQSFEFVFIYNLNSLSKVVFLFSESKKLWMNELFIH